jgi:murein DD-endopeptidase MepM/ murein hydrolase activator NlpD
MAKPQMPLDGKFGKAWKVTSPFGWRIHPIEKYKKHHNGVDLWGPAKKIYNEAWHDGKVIAAGTSALKNPDKRFYLFHTHSPVDDFKSHATVGR